MRSKVTHTIEPVYDENSRILILGTMPSPKSREYGFYYTHPQNRFWRILSDLLGVSVPTDNIGRRSLLIQNKIALWDVLHSCIIKGADDASIKKPEVNDISIILNAADIKAVFTTGKTAYKLYNKYCFKNTGRDAISLPSTSPANCRFYTYEAILSEYKIILEQLKN